MRAKTLCCTFLFAGLAFKSVTAQLVNIESKRMQTDSIRFALKSDAHFNYSKQNDNSFFTVNLNLTTQIKSRDLQKIWFLLGNYSLAKSADADLQNSWFLHLRYNQKLSQLIRAEAFIQHQSNQLLIIDSRFLVGAGFRLKLLSGDFLNAYLGNAAMYEIDNSHDYERKNYNFRHNVYFTISYTPEGNRVQLINTLYFQPLYRSIADHRVLQQFRVEFPVTRVFSLSGSYNYALFSMTPAGTRDTSSKVLFGLTLTL